MSTLTLRPNAAGDLTQIAFQYPSETYHWDKCDEVVADDTETYVYNTAPNIDQIDLYNLENTDQTGHITSVVIYCRFYWPAAYQSGTNIQIAIKTEGTAYYTTIPTKTAYWETYIKTYTTNPKVGGAWTWTQINALQAGGRLIQDASIGVNLRLTQVYVEVNYSPLQDYTRTCSTIIKPKTKYPKLGRKEVLKSLFKLISEKTIKRRINLIIETLLELSSLIKRKVILSTIQSSKMSFYAHQPIFEATRLKLISIQVNFNVLISRKFSVSSIFHTSNILSSLVKRRILFNFKLSNKLTLLLEKIVSISKSITTKFHLLGKFVSNKFFNQKISVINLLLSIKRKSRSTYKLISIEIDQLGILSNLYTRTRRPFVRLKFVVGKKSYFIGLRKKFKLIFLNPTGRR